MDSENLAISLLNIAYGPAAGSSPFCMPTNYLPE